MIKKIKRCYQYFKDKNQRANHNRAAKAKADQMAVINTSKIRIREQITTNTVITNPPFSCYQYFKDKNQRANHNSVTGGGFRCKSCYQYFKDKNQRANHNLTSKNTTLLQAVINTSKIRIREQITTFARFITKSLKLLSILQR